MFWTIWSWNMMVEVDSHEMLMRLTSWENLHIYYRWPISLLSVLFLSPRNVDPSSQFYLINIGQVKSLIGLNQFQFQLNIKNKNIFCLRLAVVYLKILYILPPTANIKWTKTSELIFKVRAVIISHLRLITLNLYLVYFFGL